MSTIDLQTLTFFPRDLCLPCMHEIKMGGVLFLLDVYHVYHHLNDNVLSSFAAAHMLQC